MNGKEALKRLLPAVLILLVMAAFMIPKRMQERAANQFGEPLFSHALPENTELIQKDASKTEDGGIMAAMILKTDLTSEELEDFYGDTNYPPFQEGQTVILQANPLDEASLNALKKAKLLEDGASYQFVFLYSQLE